MTQINAVLVGVGYMGRLTARYMAEKNINIVGAVSRKSFVGESLAKVAEAKIPPHIKVTTSLEDLVATGTVDVAVVTTSSDIKSLYPIAALCFKNKVNVVTISEEAFHPGFSKEYGPKLDALARENGVTIVATGVQDIFWLNAPAMLAGSCQRIDAIQGLSAVNLDVYGPAVVAQYPLDMSREEYSVHAAQSDSSDLIPFSGIALEGLVEKMGLTPTKRTVRHDPIFDTVDIASESLGRIIKAGRTCGVTEIYEIETSEKVHFKVQFVEKLNRPDETQKITWDIKGEPDLSFKADQFPGAEVTCATLVNRIPDVISAPAGFLSSGNLPVATYKRKF